MAHSIEDATQIIESLTHVWVVTSEAEQRLLTKLFENYSRYTRPVENVSEAVTVYFEVSMSQLVKVDEVNQIMETNLWLKHIWDDYKLRWDPAEFGGVESIRVPCGKIWKPDIVLYNNAVGDFQVEDKTRALLKFNGTVTWKPPAIFKSSCRMDVTYFPFDYQNCSIKFGSWTYDKAKIDLALIGSTINLDNLWENGEWVIMDASGFKHDIKYNCCEEVYADITYSLYIRRLPLFYTVNMIIPCLLISFLTVLVFYLPSDCGEKVTLCISVLLSLTVFLLVITEIIPSTSLVIPLIGEYLLFTMIFIILSIVITVFVLNVHYRTPKTHTMPSWVRTIFVELLPRVMFMVRPTKDWEAEKPQQIRYPDCTELFNLNSLSSSSEAKCSKVSSLGQDSRCNCYRRHMARNPDAGGSVISACSPDFLDSLLAISVCPEIQQTIENVKYVAENIKLQNQCNEVEDDWKYVAMVIDRICLWLFILVCVSGTVGLFLQPLMLGAENTIAETSGG
eukprot:gi/632939181/ref/XP_007908072.1/ PREDICTED: neuronal acetylcholine receptor subunit alpha-3-like [Callorhinchus milii]